ncbi:MAG: erythromycin esterase family protein [Solirubrobacterales bacterium]
MSPIDQQAAIAEIARLATPLGGDDDGLDRLLDRVGGADVVMLGEATHGTAEFYEWRSRITRRLVAEHGFGFVAVEGDWPDAAMIDRFVRGVVSGPEDAADARSLLGRLDRWPTWMWANEEVASLMDWMTNFNGLRASGAQVRFHGLDMYSLYKSISAVLEYLADVDPELEAVARDRYACFDSHRPDEIEYARSALRLPHGCESQAVANLMDLLALRLPADRPDGRELFDAQQNARVVRDADRYYRTMLRGDARSWNIRDTHMLETLDQLLLHGASSDGGAARRGIVWAHNTHVGDYRATDMVANGYINLGGLARERYGEAAVALVGFGTHGGSVIAAPAWDGPTTSMPVPPARPGSYEDALHAARARVGADDLLLVFDDLARHGPLSRVAGHRAIGVVYDPAHEARGNYVPTALTDRYDAFIFIDRTEGLHPLPATADVREMPETWPSGV